MRTDDLLLRAECYVAVRKALGYAVRSEEKLLKEFIQFLELNGASSPIRAQTAIEWACAPAPGRGPSGEASRLKVVRRFLSHLQAFEFETEVPGPGFRNCILQNHSSKKHTDWREVLESQAPITSCVCALPIENVKTEDKGEEQKVDCKEKIKKALRLDTYTIGAALRNLHRIRWTLNEAPKGIRAVLSVYFNRELRNQLQARNQNLKIDQLLSQIDIQELGRIAQTYAGGEQSIWTKYLDARKWLTRSVQQVRRLRLVRNPPDDVLDLGCGAGYFLFVLKQLGSRVLGLDLDHDPIFNEMIRLLGIERIGFAITRRVRLPELGSRKFDLITAWAVCFNNYDHEETVWGPQDWDFLLDDLSERLTPNGQIVFSLNPQLDGKFYSEEIGKLFTRRSNLMDGRVIIFTKRRLDATAKGTPTYRVNSNQRAHVEL